MDDLLDESSDDSTVSLSPLPFGSNWKEQSIWSSNLNVFLDKLDLIETGAGKETKRKLSPRPSTSGSFSSLHDAYSPSCPPLDWSKLNSKDADQLCNSEDRFHHALHGSYFFDPPVSLGQRLARAGLKTPERGTGCLLELAISCEDLPLNAAGKPPDPACVLLVYSLLERKWAEAWESDVVIRSQTPTFQHILRLSFPAGVASAVLVVFDMQRSSRSKGGRKELGRVKVNLEELNNSCPSSLKVGSLSLELKKNEEEQESSQESSGLGRVSFVVERIKDDNFVSTKLRSIVMNAGSGGSDLQTPNKFVPRFQRGLLRLQQTAADLFREYRTIDCRNEIKSSVRRREHEITMQVFLNILSYCGILDQLSSSSAQDEISELIPEQERTLKISREEAIASFKAGMKEKGLEVGLGTSRMRREQFEESMKQVVAFIQERNERKHDKTASLDQNASGSLAARSSTAGSPRRRYSIRTPSGQCDRMSMSRASRSKTLTDRLREEHGKGAMLFGTFPALPQETSSTSLLSSSKSFNSARNVGRGRKVIASGSQTDRTHNRPLLASSPLSRPLPQRPQTAVKPIPFLRESEIGSLLHYAPTSPNVQIRKLVAKPIAALSSSEQSSGIMQANGVVQVLVSMLRGRDREVMLDCFDALSQLVRTSRRACEDFVERRGLELCFSFHHDSTPACSAALDLLEGVLLSSSSSADVGDRFSERNFRGIAKFVSMAENPHAAKSSLLFMHLTRLAVGMAETWESLRADTEEHEISLEEGKESGMKMLLRCFRLPWVFDPCSEKTILYRSMKYDSTEKDASSSIGRHLLLAFWTLIAPSNDNQRTCIEALVREGAHEVLAQVLQEREGEIVEEDDVLCLRCLSRMSMALSAHGTNLVDPNRIPIVMLMLKDQQHAEPFCWLEEETLQQMIRCCRFQRKEANSILARQEDEETSCFLIVSGGVRVISSVKTSSKMNELTTLKGGHLFGKSSMMRGEARNATLLVQEEAEILEISLASFLLAVTQFSSGQVKRKVLQTMLKEGLHPNRRQEKVFFCRKEEVLQAQSRRGIFCLQAALVRILQILLQRMPRVSKFEEQLKTDDEVQNSVCVLLTHAGLLSENSVLAVKRGFMVPVMKLLFASSSSISKNAELALLKILSSHEVRGEVAGSRKSRGEVKEERRVDLADLLCSCIAKKMGMSITHQTCNLTLLELLSHLIRDNRTRSFLFRKLSCSRLLFLIKDSLDQLHQVGGGGGDSSSLSSDIILPSLKALEVISREQEATSFFLDASLLEWIERLVQRCQPHDDEVAQTFLILTNRFSSKRESAVPEWTRLASYEASKQAHKISTSAAIKDALSSSKEMKKSRIARLMRMAQLQAEESWESNVNWLFHKKQDGSELLRELETWHADRTRSQSERLRSGLDSVLRLNRQRDDITAVLKRVLQAAMRSRECNEALVKLKDAGVINGSDGVLSFLQEKELKRRLKSVQMMSRHVSVDSSSFCRLPSSFGRRLSSEGNNLAMSSKVAENVIMESKLMSSPSRNEADVAMDDEPPSWDNIVMLMHAIQAMVLPLPRPCSTTHILLLLLLLAHCLPLSQLREAAFSLFLPSFPLFLPSPPSVSPWIFHPSCCLPFSFRLLLFPSSRPVLT